MEGGELVIARILHGGMVAQQGLLHVGDIIKEVNGQPVGSDPRALQELLRSASGSVILKILPSYQEPHLPRQVSPSTKVPIQHEAQGVAEPAAVRVTGFRVGVILLPALKSKMGVGPAAGGGVAGDPAHLRLLLLCTCAFALGLGAHAQVQGMCVHSRPVAPECIICSCMPARLWVRRVRLPGVLCSCLLVFGLWRSGCFVHFSYCLARAPSSEG